MQIKKKHKIGSLSRLVPIINHGVQKPIPRRYRSCKQKRKKTPYSGNLETKFLGQSHMERWGIKIKCHKYTYLS